MNLRPLAAALLLTMVPPEGWAQQAPDGGASARLTGSVTDVTDAALVAVPVQVFEAAANTEGADAPLRQVITDARGRFDIPLPPGEYRVVVSILAFLPFEQRVQVGPGGKTLDIVLELEPVQETVAVTPPDELIDSARMSLGSTTLAGDELLDLPQDEEDLAAYLLLLAGADITGDLDEDILANFVIDGFADDRLPSPDRIAQIIIDPDSLSADGGGQPRIEIVTRPGTGEWRRSLDIGFADESLNARTPGELRKEPRQTRDVEFEIEGPLVPGTVDVTVGLGTRSEDEAGNSLRAVTPSGELFAGVVQPQRQRELEVGAEIQLDAGNRLDARFTLDTERASNRGVGGFSLPERGSMVERTDWRIDIRERIFREDLTNDVRILVSRQQTTEAPVRTGVAIDVADAFRGGGGTSRGRRAALTIRADDTLRLERGAWNLRWGGWMQYARRRNRDEENFNGTFEFASLHDYCVATGDPGLGCAETRAILDEAFARGVEPTYLDARGSEVAITGVPTTFTRAFGNPELEFSELSFSTHLEADRRVGEKARLQLGVGYEATNHSRSFLRVNPTASFRYQLTEDTLVSVGGQLTYRDFSDYERLRRNDGATHETELFISSPSFPDPGISGTAGTGAETASLWRLDPDYRPPYSLGPQVSLTRQVPGNTRLTLSYSAGFGYRQRRTPNVNAPFPGTPLPDEILSLPREERQAAIDQMRPLFPYVGNVTQVESTGRSSSHTVRIRVRPRGSFDLFGWGLSGNLDYTYRVGYDDDDDANPWAREWGPTRREHTVQSRFRIRLPDEPRSGGPFLRALARATYSGTNLSVNVRANTGRLYSLRAGHDLNGDQSTRDRPEGVARNSEVGPGSWSLDMTLTKDYALAGGGIDTARQDRGGRGFRRRPDGPRLRVQARARNLLNHTQPLAYGSVVTSPLFGLPTGFTGGRTVTLSLNLDF